MKTLLKRVWYVSSILLCLAIVPLSGFSQNNFIIDHVDGQPVAGKLSTSTPITFYIKMNNTTGLAIMTGANGFRVYSTDGANWDTTNGSFTGGITGAMWDIQVVNNFSHSTDGLGADTIGFGGTAISGTGIPAGFNQITYKLTIGPIAKSQHGKSICVDSSYYSGAEWRWSLQGGGGVDPSWGGPYCYMVDSTLDDADGDGHVPPNDNCILVYNPGQEDGDLDGVGNVCDNCPATFNPGQADADNDGIGDVCDGCTDTDGDGWGNPGFPANTCVTDNCPTTYNISQGDLDLDGIGDACDPQTDLTFNQQSGDPASVYAMRTGDLNRDNFTDIIYSGTSASPGLFITFAIDANSFAAASQCYNLHDCALAIDFVNSDEWPDIVAATVDSIFVLLNDGTTNCAAWSLIKFAYPTPFVGRGSLSTAPAVPSVSTGYFDNDNNTDFFVAPSTVLYGNGNGNVSGSATVPAVASSISKGDFDNDGYEDLLAVDGDSAVLMLNDGIGNYSRSEQIFVHLGHPTVPIDNAVDDLDKDCNLDFVVVTPNSDSSGQSLLTLGFGDGLGSVEQTSNIAVNGLVQDILVIDIDRDNILDLLASNATQQRVEIYRGNGDRTFDAPEFFSTASAGGAAFTLASADFDRDGEPDFLSGGSNNGNVLLTSSNLANTPVLPDEMTLTGLTNVTMKVTNPLGYGVSQQSQTIAGADIWRLDVNNDDSLDEQIVDYNLLDGTYDLTYYLRPEFSGGGNQPVTSSVRIDGSQQAVILQDYNFSGTTRTGRSVSSCASDSIVIKFNPKYIDTSFLEPNYGQQTNTREPKYNWSHIFSAKSATYTKYHIQVDTLLDFSTVFYQDSTKTQPTLCGLALGAGGVYYWRVRAFDGASWTPFSNPLVAYIGGGCCTGPRRGDMNSDGADANILDLTFMVDRIFRGGAAPTCPEESDVNHDCVSHNILDLTFLVDRIFRSGPAPAPCPTPVVSK